MANNKEDNTIVSLSGIITGFVLGLGAAFGETTVLILTADTGAYRLPERIYP
jgi:ABC-type phosphate transport system permease subunit